jgi:hypothetical protein
MSSNIATAKSEILLNKSETVTLKGCTTRLAPTSDVHVENHQKHEHQVAEEEAEPVPQAEQIRERHAAD